jgi:hypothetical protein
MTKRGVLNRLIYEGLLCLVRTMIFIGSYGMSRLCLGSLGTWGYLRGLPDPLLCYFPSFVYLPHATSSILSSELRFPLIILVPSLYLGNSSTLSSHLGSCSCPSPSHWALLVIYLDPSFNHLLQPLPFPSLSSPHLVYKTGPPTMQFNNIVRPLGHTVLNIHKTRKVFLAEYQDCLPVFLEER